MKRKHFITAVVIFALFFTMLGSIFTVVAFKIKYGGESTLAALSKYSAVYSLIKENYIGDISDTELQEQALRGMVDSLDRWSYYMSAEEYASYLDSVNNSYHGIGVTIQKDETTGGFLVVSVTGDGPAAAAGLVAGDIILAADGTDITEGDSALLKSIIKENYGGEVSLLVQRAAGGTETVAVSCEEIYTPPVACELYGVVGYISISNFESGCAQNAIAAIEELTAAGAEALVFDVRANPGGQVKEMVALLDYLLPEGELFIRVDKNGNETVETSDADCLSLPMAVLINADSYSAAEFFAAALSEYQWAVTVGEATTGKGRSQITVQLSDGSAVHLSTNKYLTPNRVDLSECGGLVPDVEAALSEEDYISFLCGELALETDTQFLAAVDAVLNP